jgi:hypothetical protein
VPKNVCSGFLRQRVGDSMCLVRRQSKGNGTRKARFATVYKLMQSAGKQRRLLNGSNLLSDVIAGVQFIDGIKPQITANGQKRSKFLAAL